MKRLYGMALIAVFATGYSWIALGQQDHADHGRADKSSGDSALKQTTCPVSGKPINREISIEYEGGQVSFCCKGCPPRFKETPNKYLPALYRQIYPQIVQVKCPVMGGPVNPEVFIEHKGQRDYFCCKGCDKKFEADPEKHMKTLPEASTKQVHCPVMGDVINPQLSAEVDGKTVYFCCKMCEPKYKENPSKYPVGGPREAGLLAHGKTAKDDLFLCPVCADKGDGIHKRSQVKMTELDDFRYAMCGSDCVEKFKQEEGRFLRVLHDRLIEYVGAGGTAFSCPMHPQIVTEDAGKCPICEMDLRPEKGFTCPMHPQVLTGEKGKCPICGMDLKPVKPRD